MSAEPQAISKNEEPNDEPGEQNLSACPPPEEVIAEPLKKESMAATEQHPSLTVEKEVKLWEAALENRSAAIRKQAAARLKKLTGKDYAN